MAEVFGVLVMILGLVICLRGLAILVLNRDGIKEVIGFSLSSGLIRASFSFFILVFLLFFAVLWLNVSMGYIEFFFDPKLGLLLKGLFRDACGAFFEEFLFRVLIFIGLIDLIRNRILLVLTAAVIFSAAHFPSNKIEAVSYLLSGIAYGFAFLKFRSFAVPFMLHFAWNFVQGSIFGFSVSGVSSQGLLELLALPSIVWNGEPQGPEGSVLGLFMRLIVISAIYLYPYQSTNQNFLVLNRSLK